MRRRWFITLSLIAALAVVAFGVVLWHWVGLSSLSSVSETVAAAKPVASAIRFAIIGLLALAWPRLPRLWGVTQRNEAHAVWMALRWSVVGWLLVIELVLGQNLAVHFLNALVGPVV